MTLNAQSSKEISLYGHHYYTSTDISEQLKQPLNVAEMKDFQIPGIKVSSARMEHDGITINFEREAKSPKIVTLDAIYFKESLLDTSLLETIFNEDKLQYVKELEGSGLAEQFFIFKDRIETDLTRSKNRTMLLPIKPSFDKRLFPRRFHITYHYESYFVDELTVDLDQ
nr:hypothetical protein [Candidatus Sigynarchaeota archaeon]